MITTPGGTSKKKTGIFRKRLRTKMFNCGFYIKYFTQNTPVVSPSLNKPLNNSIDRYHISNRSEPQNSRNKKAAF
jgi:hypothetical protein